MVEGKWWHLACFRWHKTGFWLNSYTKRVHDTKNIKRDSSQYWKIIDKMIGFWGKGIVHSIYLCFVCFQFQQNYFRKHIRRRSIPSFVPSGQFPVFLNIEGRLEGQEEDFEWTK